MKYLLIVWVMSNGHDHTLFTPVRDRKGCKILSKQISFSKNFEKASFSCVKAEWYKEVKR